MSIEQNIAWALCLLTMGVSLRAWVTTNRRLAALRANAFVTDERGVRVRYVNASAAVRAKVEQ